MKKFIIILRGDVRKTIFANDQKEAMSKALEHWPSMLIMGIYHDAPFTKPFDNLKLQAS